LADDPIDIEHARQLVLERTGSLGAERVRLADALGRVLADDAVAGEPVPAFENSAMDGFALRAADTGGATPGSPAVLRIVGESRAGLPAARLVGPGEAVRVSTGAMLPEGADAVVRIEDARADGERLEVLSAAAPGHDVRHPGEDIRPGARVVQRGVVLGPAELGVLASLDRAEVSCARPPRVAVLTTGDELQEPGEPYRPGGVRNANAHTLCSLVARRGAEVAQRRTVRDDEASTRQAIAAALGHDVVVISGGVSVGEHDHVRSALAGLGVEQVFWRLALRPGSPAWFGIAPGGGLVFGLPGNPVSAMVVFLLLVRPALCALLGTAPGRHRAKAVLDEAYEKRPGRAHAVRCRLELRDDGWHARPTGAQGSHVLSSMLGVDALALIPARSAGAQAGEVVEIELMDRL
jgi:molybdopterin molybdotransferase